MLTITRPSDRLDAVARLVKRSGGIEMEIQILHRFEPTSDWHEIYANGLILFEGDQPPHAQFQIFTSWLADRPEIDLEVRAFTVEYEQGEGDDFMPPLRAMTGESYWSDWDRAEGN
jgi:hypothetical protein